MSNHIARRVNFHLSAARNLCSMVVESGDRHQRDGLLMSTILQLELTSGFYVCEIAEGSDSVDLSPILADVKVMGRLLEAAPSQSARELAALLEDPTSCFGKIIRWSCGVRSSSRADNRLRGRLFSLDDDDSALIGSTSGSDLGFYQLPHKDEVSGTIDSVAAVITRQRNDAEEY